MHKYILSLIILGSSICSAEQIETSISTNKELSTNRHFVNPTPNDWLNHIGFFLGPMPLPFWNGNAQLSAEYLVTPWISLWGSYKRELRDSDGIFSFNFLGENLRSESKNYYAAIRLYNPLSSNWLRGFYITSGYKWNDIYTTYSPALFGGRSASRSDRDQGVYAGLGYRFVSMQRNNIVLNFDLAVNYEPGYVDKVVYDPNGTQLFGSNSDGTSDIQLQVRNRFYPEFNVGLRF